MSDICVADTDEDVKNNMIFCRACLASNVKMIGLMFEEEFKYNFTELTKLQISQTDSLPQTVCWKCYHLIKKFIAFKDICIKSEIILKKYYSLLHSQATNESLQKNHKRMVKSSLSTTNIIVTEYIGSESNIGSWDIYSHKTENETFILCPQDEKNQQIKEEIDGDFEAWYEEPNDDTFKQNLKVEYDDHFNESDDEPVVKKIKSNKRKEQRHKLQRSKNLSNFKTNGKKINNTPAKNFDMSMVIISTLSVEEQIKEMEDSRKTDEYLKAPYKCKMCAKWFVHEIVYKVHTTKHEPVSGQHLCQLCHQRFNSQRNLTNHQETHTNRYSCRICKKVVISKQNIMSHMYTEHDETNKQITCDVCRKTYKNRYTYAKHMRIHNNSKEYKCHLCPKVFLWKDNLNRHLTRHTTEKPFSCDQCTKSFYLKENLKDHSLVHSENKRFYCVECDLSYVSQAKLNQHLKRGTKHLTPDQFTFPCNLCDARYTNNTQLSMHIDKVHLNKKSHVCLQCDTAFVSKKNLKTHVRSVHEGFKKPRVHICEACGKGFSDKQVLKAHIRTHTGEKPYCCKHCGVKFAHSGAMYTHVKLVHLKQKRIPGGCRKKSGARIPDSSQEINAKCNDEMTNGGKIKIPIDNQENESLMTLYAND